MDDQTLINGLLAKRQELSNLNAELREKMAIVANDIEAVERVLDSLGYSGQLVGQTPRAARIVLFYRNELREYLRAELQKSSEPLTARELAQRLCQVEGKDWQDRRLMTDVTRRVGCALRKMRAARVVEGERTQAGQVWRARSNIHQRDCDAARLQHTGNALCFFGVFCAVLASDCFRRYRVPRHGIMVRDVFWRKRFPNLFIDEKGANYV